MVYQLTLQGLLLLKILFYAFGIPKSIGPC